MVKSFNIIGQCLEFVDKYNTSMINEDRLILNREISNYFNLCFEICKSVMGEKDKMTIYFKEKINYL